MSEHCALVPVVASRGGRVGWVRSPLLEEAEAGEALAVLDEDPAAVREAQAHEREQRAALIAMLEAQVGREEATGGLARLLLKADLEADRARLRALKEDLSSLSP